MSFSSISKCSAIDACPFISVVEFCPYENACDLLACGCKESVAIYSIIFLLNQKPTSTIYGDVIESYKKLITFDYKGAACLSWSPLTNMRYLPKCAKIAIGMHNSDICIIMTDFKKDTKVMQLSGHKKAVNSVAFEPVTGIKLASISDDHTCIIWNVENGDIFHNITLVHAGIDVCWNTYETGKLMVAEQSGCIRFYDVDDSDQCDNCQPILCLEADCGTLTSCHWCPSNSLRIGACIGNEWVLWNINNILPEENRQAHSGGCTRFRWSHHNEDVFMTQGRPKHTTSIHHLGHREMLFQDVTGAGSGGSWHLNLPICAIAFNEKIHVYDLNSLTQP